MTGTKSPLIYEIENLLHQRRNNVHARRIILHRADKGNRFIEKKLQEAAEHLETV